MEIRVAVGGKPSAEPMVTQLPFYPMAGKKHSLAQKFREALDHTKIRHYI